MSLITVRCPCCLKPVQLRDVCPECEGRLVVVNERALCLNCMAAFKPGIMH